MTAEYFYYKPITTFTLAKRTTVRAAESDISVLPIAKTEVSASVGIAPVSQLFLSGSIAPGWKIEEPLPVLIEQDEDNSFVVSDSLFAVYGIGDTRREAIDDYVMSLIEYYAIIATHTDPLAQAHLQRLQAYLQPTIQ